MAEPDSILQLGIEAARDNKKEEARQLFRLLTRQEPPMYRAGCGWLASPRTAKNARPPWSGFWNWIRTTKWPSRG